MTMTDGTLPTDVTGSTWPDKRLELHQAVCSLCSRVVEPSAGQAWRRAVVQRWCESCHGWLEIRLIDLSGAHGSVEPSIPIAIHTRAYRLVPRHVGSA